MKNKCPHCDSVIYSRRNPMCGVCGKRLPEDLLFPDDVRAAIERDLADSKRRAGNWRASEGTGDGGHGLGGFGGDFGGDFGGGGDCGGAD